MRIYPFEKLLTSGGCAAGTGTVGSLLTVESADVWCVAEFAARAVVVALAITSGLVAAYGVAVVAVVVVVVVVVVVATKDETVKDAVVVAVVSVVLAGTTVESVDGVPTKVESVDVAVVPLVVVARAARALAVVLLAAPCCLLACAS